MRIVNKGMCFDRLVLFSPALDIPKAIDIRQPIGLQSIGRRMLTHCRTNTLLGGFLGFFTTTQPSTPGEVSQCSVHSMIKYSQFTAVRIT